MRIELTINNNYNNYGLSLQIVEKAVWYDANGGEWDEDDGTHVFTSGDYRGSGLIRFRDPDGEFFSVAVGIGYGLEQWCDVQVNLARADTGVKLLPEYYGGRLGSESHQDISRTTTNGRTVRLRITAGSPITAVLEYS